MPLEDPGSGGNLLGFILPSDRYTVLSVAQGSMLSRSNTLLDSIEITFMVTSRAGVFTHEVILGADSATENGIDLTPEADTIDALYNL